MNKKKYYILLIFCFAILLRLFHLGTESLWYDELFTTYLCLHDFNSFWNLLINDVHPPIYNIIIYFIYNYIGNSEFLLRLPSVLFSIINLYFLYKLVKIINPDLVLIVLILDSLSWGSIYFAQELRSYSLLYLLTSMFVYYCLKYNKSKKISYYLYLILLSFLLQYTHYYGSLFLYIILIYKVVENIKNKQLALKYILLFIISLIILFPMLGIIISQIKKFQEIWMHVLYPQHLITSIDFLTFNYRPLFIFFAVIIMIGILKFSKKQIKFTKNELFLAYWLVIPFILVMIKSWFSTPIFTSRHFIISIAPFFILISIIINSFSIKLRRLTLYIFIIISCINLFYIHNFYFNEKRANYRDCIQFLNKKNQPIIFVDVPRNDDINTLKYYAKDSIYKYRSINCSFEKFKELKINQEFYLFYDSIALIKSLIVIDSLNKNYKKIDSISFKGLKIYHYKMNYE
mgnify:CR=1 FL=1